MRVRFSAPLLLALSLFAVPVHAGHITFGSSLGPRSFFALLGQYIQNNGPTNVNGNIGAGEVRGFPPGTVTNGAILLDEFGSSLENGACSADLTGVNLGGVTLRPGVYCFDGPIRLSGTLTLDAAGNPAAEFRFRSVLRNHGLTADPGSAVVLANGTGACYVYWDVRDALIGAGTTFAGNIGATGVVVMKPGATLNGRVYNARAVHLDTNQVSVCSPPPTPTSRCPHFTVTSGPEHPSGQVGAPSGGSFTVLPSWGTPVPPPGGTIASISFSGGTIPPGMTFTNSPTIARITGTPTVAGVFPFSVTATSTQGGCTATLWTRFTATGPGCATGFKLTLNSALLGSPYSQSTLTAPRSGRTYSIVAGALPAGLTLDPATGTISGTPLSPGVFYFTVRETSPSCVVEGRFTLGVAAPQTSGLAAADLVLTKTTPATRVPQGGAITYTLTASNSGPAAAANVTLTDYLPAALQFQSIAAPAEWSCTTPAAGATGDLQCTTPLFAPGATATFTLVTTVAPTATGTVTNRASLDFPGNDPVPGNSLSILAPGVTIGGVADLQVTKTTTATSAARGGTLRYVVTLTNAGPEPAARVVLTDSSGNLRFKSLTPAPGWQCFTPAAGASMDFTCRKDTMLPGETATFIVVGTTATSTSFPGPSDNAVTASHSSTDPNFSNNQSRPSTPVVDSTADLRVTKTSNVTSARQGEQIPYTITITNLGPDAATTVGFTDVLPAGLSFQSIATPAGFTCHTPAVGTSGTINCVGGTLANGASAVFTLVTRLTASSGSIVNSVSADSGAFDPAAANSSASAPAIIAAAGADLSIAKTTTSTTYSPGSTIAYTITVANSGPSAATNVTVQDPISGVEVISATPSQGTCSGATTVVCNLGTIANAATATITLTVRATATSGPINNTATVTSPDDPNAANNSGSAPALAFVAAAIPALSEWALLALLAALLGLAVVKLR